jgi:glycosyltransferase 2 family protein
VNAGRSRSRLISLLAWTAALLGIVLLVFELRSADLSQLLHSVRPGWLSAAFAATALSMFAAAYNLHGFAPVRLKLRSTLLAQLAVGFTRTLTPSLVSTPAVATRYLTRSGASLPVALGAVSAAQIAQAIVTTIVVGAMSVTSGSWRVPDIQLTPVLLTVATISVLVLAGLVLARSSATVRRAVSSGRGSCQTLRAQARRRPGQVVVGVIASAVLTLTHVLAFVCCVYAAGGHGSLLALAVVYLGSAAAGSLVPTPGGTGAVEAALVAGLTTSGLSLPVAVAAAVLSRLESVWLPAAPGWFALRSLRRDGLL